MSRAPVPHGLQAELAQLILRIEQAGRYLDADDDALAAWLIRHKILNDDVPRLLGHLTPATLAWMEAEAGGPRTERPPLPRHIGPPAPRRRWFRLAGNPGAHK